jgi:hypothetical protein
MLLILEVFKVYLHSYLLASAGEHSKNGVLTAIKFREKPDETKQQQMNNVLNIGNGKGFLREKKKEKVNFRNE